MSENKKPAMCRMVGWYDPRQLARTAVEVAVSTIFGRHADYRITEALVPFDENDNVFGDEAGQPPDAYGIYDYSLGQTMWLDYISDTGDGWDSTYSVAYHASRPQLNLAGHDDPTVRGSVLVFGGDEVYPTASRQVYRDRLIDPFVSALPETESPNPHVFAIPGNHDWYDSLVSFTRLFCSRRWFGGWQTRQSRSYFALKLPQRWWLIGTDVQLDSDVDIPQVRYFKRVAKRMNDGDRIILCTAEPHWIYARIYGKDDRNYTEDNLAFLENKIFCNQQIAVYLSGDLHHYRRHATDGGLQKITAGGGGGFLHPTHGPDVSELADGYRLKKAFPPSNESKKLTWKNLGFLFMNPWFGFVTALLYTLTCWSVMANIGGLGMHQWQLALKRAIATSIANPTAVFWIALVWGGFLMFTDVHSPSYRIIAGTVHGLAHVLATFLIGWFATYVGMTWLHWPFRSPKQLLLAGAIIFALGWIVGSIVMGIYLLISLNIFSRHSNEAFSALACPDWKNFLRLRIDAQGGLTIFPIGIRRVARKWKPTGTTGGPAFVADDAKATPPELIEQPIKI
ncbi:MAG: metallophosphoesterase [Pyrinomonadaceae bacterium]